MFCNRTKVKFTVQNRTIDDLSIGNQRIDFICINFFKDRVVRFLKNLFIPWAQWKFVLRIAVSDDLNSMDLLNGII